MSGNGEDTTSSNTNSRSNNNQFVVPNLTNFMTMKLNGDNFLCWKHQLLTVFKTLGLEKHVDCSYVPPSTPPESVDRWSKEDNFVSVCINSTLDISIAHLAIDTKSASDLWKVIEDTYLQQAYAKKSQLKIEFQNIKQGSNSVTVYCDSIKRLCDSLRSIGEIVTESDLVLQTLHGLNTSYNTFVLNIENSDSQPNFAQLRSRLLMYEQRVNQQSEVLMVSAMSALKVSDPPHNISKESYNNLACQICRKQGHSADRCFFRYTPDNNQGRGNNGERWNNGDRGIRYSGRSNGDWRGPNRGRFGGRSSGGNRNGNWKARPNPPSGYFIGTESGLTFGPHDQHFFQSHGPAFGYQFGPSGNNNSVTGNSSGQFPQAYTSEFGPAHFAKWAKQHGTSANLSFSNTCSMVDSWIPDSGATTHMTPDPSLVRDAVAYTGPERVVVDSQGIFTPPHSA